MRRIESRVLALGAAALIATTSSLALAQVQTAPPAVPVPQSPPPPAAAPAPPVEEEAPPPEQQWSVAQEGGRWVYTVDHGWVWIPDTSAPVVYGGVPYVWLYTPSVGWSWYVSPWGHGRYHYGPWVRHTWQPRTREGGRVWVAPQHVHAQLGHPRGYQGPRGPSGPHQQPQRGRR